jgi:hypothetical protein
MWTYSQSTGRLYLNGVTIAIGYAGRGADKDIPADQTVVDEGPLPQGIYAIQPAITDPHLGPLAMTLTPNPGNQMFGRSGFYIHGDSFAHPGQASCGCIVLGNSARSQISLSHDRVLWVV